MIIDCVEWSDLASEFLAGAVISASVEDYKRQVEAGASLFRVSLDGEAVGFYILRVDTHAEKTIGVLVVAAGKPGYSFADALMPVIERQFIGVDEIHQFCSRAGMVKKLTRQGWEATHMVMRKVVKNG
jgi:hypothetical protein